MHFYTISIHLIVIAISLSSSSVGPASQDARGLQHFARIQPQTGDVWPEGSHLWYGDAPVLHHQHHDYGHGQHQEREAISGRWKASSSSPLKRFKVRTWIAPIFFYICYSSNPFISDIQTKCGTQAPVRDGFRFPEPPADFEEDLLRDQRANPSAEATSESSRLPRSSEVGVLVGNGAAATSPIQSAAPENPTGRQQRAAPSQESVQEIEWKRCCWRRVENWRLIVIALLLLLLRRKYCSWSDVFAVIIILADTGRTIAKLSSLLQNAQGRRSQTKQNYYLREQHAG